MLSIIIPTYKRNDLLSGCLDCLKLSYESFDMAAVEVIVTDDSPDADAKLLIELNYNWVKWVEGAKKGPASNRNSGASKALYDWLIFLDDDCLPSPGLIKAYYDEIVKGEYVALEGAIDVDRPQERYDEQSPINLTGDCFWACNICVAKSLFKQVGGFDENFPFPAWEDTDFYVRVKEVAPVKFLIDAMVIHPWRRVGLFTTYKKQFASIQYYNKKHGVKELGNYRLNNVKGLILFSISNFKTLKKYSFKGYKYYIEMLYFYTLMIVK